MDISTLANLINAIPVTAGVIFAAVQIRKLRDHFWLFCFHEVPSYVSVPIKNQHEKITAVSNCRLRYVKSYARGGNPNSTRSRNGRSGFSLATSDGSQVSLKDFKGKW